MLAMADNASDEGYCWPGYKTIARKVNVQRRSAMRLISQLEQDNYLQRIERYKDETNERTSNAYQLNITKLYDHVVTGESPRDDLRVTTVVTGESPESSLEPSFKKLEEEATAQLAKLYTENLGMITPIAADWIKEAVEEYPPEWYRPAFEEAIKNNAHTWAYIAAILKRWKAQGFRSDNRTPKGQPPKRDYDQAAAEFLEMFNET